MYEYMTIIITYFKYFIIVIHNYLVVLKMFLQIISLQEMRGFPSAFYRRPSIPSVRRNYRRISPSVKLNIERQKTYRHNGVGNLTDGMVIGNLTDGYTVGYFVAKSLDTLFCAKLWCEVTDGQVLDIIGVLLHEITARGYRRPNSSVRCFGEYKRIKPSIIWIGH